MAMINRLESDLQAATTGLVLFDVLHGYLHPRDEDAQRYLRENWIIENLQKLQEAARAANMTIFYPSGAHAEDGSDTVARLTSKDQDLQPFDKSKPIKPPFSKGSLEASVAAELTPRAGEVVCPKHRWNAFYQTDLELQLRVRGIHTIILAGGSTEVGIASTAYAASVMDLGLVIVSDACGSLRGENPYFMTRVFPRMGRVLSVDETISLIGT